jgi:2-dehydro-3-deoxyphosphogluconate aldolase/(4S)-4-hydroxy-2-oxoglutarate aldolase
MVDGWRDETPGKFLRRILSYCSSMVASVTRADLAEKHLREYGVLPVVELEDVRQAEDLFAALAEGGLAAAEITMRTPDAAVALEKLIDAHPDALLGAGTVRNLESARRMVDIGASFVVSPGIDEEIIGYCLEHDVMVIPGVCTPTEIMRAVRAGARLLKFFPAEAAGGVGFLRALAGPFRDVSFVPTGGISEVNLKNYLSLANVAACGGSWIVATELLGAGRFDEITHLARRARGIVEEVGSG